MKALKAALTGALLAAAFLAPKLDNVATVRMAPAAVPSLPLDTTTTTMNDLALYQATTTSTTLPEPVTIAEPAENLLKVQADGCR